MRRAISTLSLSTLLACAEPPTTTPDAVSENPATTDAEELAAFARLYGAVRWFHPSDAAAAADWDALAVAGARAVVAGADRTALQAALQRFVDSIAPTVQVYVEGSPPPELELSGEGPTVAWQHQGWSVPGDPSIYRSIRVGRTRRSPVEGPPYGSILASLDAKPFHGERVRLEARIKVGAGVGALIVGIEHEGGEEAEILALPTDDLVMPGDWETRTLEVTVPERGAKLQFGGVVSGEGDEGLAWFDDFRVVILSTGQRIELRNPGFEDQTNGWLLGADNYEYSVIDDSGSRVAQLKQEFEETDAPLFEAVPGPGETVDLELGAGLFLRLPVALPDSLAAVPPPAPAEPIGPDALLDASDPAVRAAAVVVGWSALRQFYPYFDTIDVDWDRVLDETIADVLDDHGADDLRETLERMIAKLHDGHATVTGVTRPALAQIELARVEGKIVVIAAPDGSGLAPGDELLSVDEVPVADAYAEAASRTSGSPQWIDVKLLRWGLITAGPVDTPARLELRRGDRTFDVELVREPKHFEAAKLRPAIERLDDGVFYVDLIRATWPEIQGRLIELAAAPGVVFDLRGYPNGNHDILQHLIDEPDATKWMFVPQFIYPHHHRSEQRRPAGWSGYDWGLTPAEPRIAGRVAFMTDARAISYAESVMGCVEGLRLGEIVGAPTAGANGNVNPFTVPGGFRLVFTGMKVTRFDGRQHHQIGVVPTIPVEPTIEGIMTGRDEVLERALAVVRSSGPA